jgi:hypothetical protein
MFAASTVNAIPAWRSSSWRRGEAEARIRFGGEITNSDFIEMPSSPSRFVSPVLRPLKSRLLK